MQHLDIVGIGNALVDIIVHVDEKTLAAFDLQKSVMHPITTKESHYMLQKLEKLDLSVSSGGSIANSLVGVSSLGGKAAFVGSIGIDQFGEVFTKDLNEYGVVPHMSSLMDHATGHAIIFVTPDGERTFATHVGASAYLSQNNVSKALISSCDILYIEGYLLAHEESRKAALHAAALAEENNIRVAVDMSNVSIVREYGDPLQTIIRETADIVFANSDEARAFTGKEGVEALKELGSLASVAIITMHDQGSLIWEDETIHEIAATPADVTSVNGAGDIYAAGILYGIVKNIPLNKAGEIASFLAAQVVEVDEARLPKEYVQNALTKEFEGVFAF